MKGVHSVFRSRSTATRQPSFRKVRVSSWVVQGCMTNKFMRASRTFPKTFAFSFMMITTQEHRMETSVYPFARASDRTGKSEA